MAATSILQPGITEATSSDIVVAAGAVATVGIYCATKSAMPTGVHFDILQLTPGAPNAVGQLAGNSRATSLMGPGTFRVRRPAYDGAAFGVFADLG